VTVPRKAGPLGEYGTVRGAPFMRLAVSLAATSLWAGALAAPAAGAPSGWRSPLTVSARGEPAFVPAVSVSAASGRGIAVWYRVRPGRSGLTLRAASVATTGRLGRAYAVGAAAEPEGSAPSLPRVAIAPNGAALAVWLGRDRANNLRVMAATARPGGRLGSQRALSDPGQPAFDPDVAFDAQGNAVAVWLRFDGATTRVQAAFRPAGGAFGATQTLSSPAAPANQPDVAINRSGAAVVVWLLGDGFRDVVQAARRPAGGTFGPIEALSDPTLDADAPSVALDANANTTVLWVQESNSTQRIASAYAPVAGLFGRVTSLSPASQIAFDPRVGVDATGRATALWSQGPVPGSPGTKQIVTTSGSRGGFGARQVLSASRQNDQLQAVLAVNPAGRAVAAWTNSPITGATPLLAALRTSRTRRFDRAAAVTARGLSAGFPAVAIDGRGRSIALWEDAVGSSGSRGILGSAHR
jgi:hypothetical protein